MTPSEVEGPGLEALPVPASFDLEALGGWIRADSRALAEAEPRFAPALAHGTVVPVRLRAPGFSALVRFHLDTGLRPGAAEACWRRLCSGFDPADPAPSWALDERHSEGLAAFSRRKARYAGCWPRRSLPCTFDRRMSTRNPDDEAAIARLTSLTGIWALVGRIAI